MNDEAVGAGQPVPGRRVPGLPLQLGSDGEAVLDLQHRLAALGHPVTPDGVFAGSTVDAVRAFQAARGLHQDGAVGPQTWRALVDASWQLGSRLLYLAAPMQRGDDVAVLQRRLGALGFDSGRVDGIFGPLTDAALADFQRNAGLPVDRIFGGASMQALDRLGRRSSEFEPVATVREREALRRGAPTLDRRRLVVVEPGGLGALAHLVSRAVARAGARVLVFTHPDPSEQAAAANGAQAEVTLGLQADASPDGCASAYYQHPTSGYASATGRHLARLVQCTVPGGLGIVDLGASGMSTSLLLETRMPAVVVTLAPPELVVERAAEVARHLHLALERWVADPLG